MAIKRDVDNFLLRAVGSEGIIPSGNNSPFNGGGGGGDDGDGGEGGGGGGEPELHPLRPPADFLPEFPFPFPPPDTYTPHYLEPDFTPPPMDTDTYTPHSNSLDGETINSDGNSAVRIPNRNGTMGNAPCGTQSNNTSQENGVDKGLEVTDSNGAPQNYLNKNTIASQSIGNLLLNPSFEKWNALSTTGSATDKVLLNWTAYGGGTISKETTIVKNSNTAVKLYAPSNGTSAVVYQGIHTNINIALLQGKTLTLSGWVRNNGASNEHSFITIYTGGIASAIYYPPDDNTWHSFSLSIIVESDATAVWVEARGVNDIVSPPTTTTLYVDSLSLVVGSATSENSLSSLPTSDGGVPNVIAGYNNNGLDADKPAVADMLVGASFYATDTKIEYYRNA